MCGEVAKTESDEGFCPHSGTKGQPVPWVTVGALVRGPLPSRQQIWICLDPHCEIVYFGDQGAQIPIQGLHVAPGFKGGERDDLLCYCFGYRRSQVREEILTTGKAMIPSRIHAETKAGNCACEVRNPTGRCCLGEVRRFVDSVLATKPMRPARR